MAGYIIYNGFWNEQPSQPVRSLCQAAKQHGVILRALKNTELINCISKNPMVCLTDGTVLGKGDFALFWDKDTRLARALEDVGVHLYNSATAIASCDDKSETHRLLSSQGIPMPDTMLAPMAYTEIGTSIETFLTYAKKTIGFPLVVKECYGSLGQQVHLARTGEELHTLVYAMHAKPFLLQRFIKEAAGEDVRLYVVNNQVVAAMKRTSAEDFRANLALGGSAEPYQPTEEEALLACRCCQTLGLLFAGVDILHTKEGLPLVCEVNSNAYMEGMSACTGIDVADEIIKAVLEQEGEKEKAEWKT